MRLRLLTIVGTLALALAVPSAALAHHGRGRHHQHHHKNRSNAHHARFQIRNIGPTGTTPTPTPSTTPSEENAGTVTSYEKEVLTLTLKDNSTVSGKVTADTHVRCIGPTATNTEQGEDGGPGDDNGQGDDQSRGDMSQSGDGWGDHKDGGDDDGEWGQQSSTPEPPCDTSSLTAGTVVRSAQLRIGPSGSEWECIVLVRPAA